MTAPRFYTWDDDGSPGRALTGNLQNRLKQILVPCLVTGYGDKPGAGWTLEHEHANGFTLSNGDAYVNFVSNLTEQAPYPAMQSSVIHIYAAESLIDTSGAIVDGGGLCSGTYRKGEPELNNYPRHALGATNHAFDVRLSTLQWSLVADDKTFILSVSSGDSDIYRISAHRGSFSLSCGAALLDSEITGNFLVLGGDIVNYNSSSQTKHAFCRGYTSPRDLFSGLSVLSVVGAEPYMSTDNIDPSKVVAAPARINLQQPRLVSDDLFVGRLRGVVYDDILRSNYSWSTALKSLGFSGTDFTDRGKIVSIDGHNYAFARSYSGNSFLTDNPDFW